MPIREPDLYTTANLIGGLPVCVFSSKPYRRFVTNIVVENGVPSNVDCYVGSLTSYPVATSKLGDKNTLSGRIVVPAGQPFFVRWSAAPPDLSTTFARVSFERDDTPLAEVSNVANWNEQLIESLTIPSNAKPNDAQIFLGAQVPSRVQDVIDNYVGGPGLWPAAACVLYGKPSGQYWFDAVVFPNNSQVTVAIVRGVVDGAFQGQISQVWRYRSISGLSRVAIGDDNVFESVTVGGPVSSRPGLVMQYNPLVTPATTDLGSQFGSDVTNIYGGSSGSITLAAQTVNLGASNRIDFGNSIKSLQNGFVNATMLIANSILTPSSNVTLTTSTQILPSANVTITIPNHGARWAAVGVFDLEWKTPDTQNDAVGILEVDGVTQPGLALLRSNEAGESTDQRATVSQVWSGLVSGGNHTWRLGARKDGAGGTAQCNASLTRCLLQVFC